MSAGTSTRRGVSRCPGTPALPGVRGIRLRAPTVWGYQVMGTEGVEQGPGDAQGCEWHPQWVVDPSHRGIVHCGFLGRVRRLVGTTMRGTRVGVASPRMPRVTPMPRHASAVTVEGYQVTGTDVRVIRLRAPRCPGTPALRIPDASQGSNSEN